MPETFIWGPVSGQKCHARMPFLPLTPLKYFTGHIFLKLDGSSFGTQAKVTFDIYWFCRVSL